MFLIIDGSSMIHTNYHGTLPPEMRYAKTDEQKEAAYKRILQVTDNNGNVFYTNAIYTSLRMLFDILTTNPDITHIAVVFDKTRNTFRRQIDPNYKANRKATSHPLKQQLQAFEEILNHIGIPAFSDSIFEADDLAGSIANHFKTLTDQPIVLMTKDHDYLQLIDDNVFCWISQSSHEKAMDIMVKRLNMISTNTLGNIMQEPSKNRGVLCTPQRMAWFDKYTVLQEEGVLPYQIPDLKGLCGDSSDNIPGVSGVGPTSAIPLLTYYKNINGIYDAIDAVRTDKQKIKDLNAFWKTSLGIARSPYKKLADSKDIAMQSRKLAQIQLDAPIETDEDIYKYQLNSHAVVEILHQYQMRSLESYLDKLQYIQYN